MRSRRVLPLASLVIACGADSAESPGPPIFDVVESGAASDAGAPFAWGIDVRPPNPTCRAPARPAAGPGTVALARAFPNLSLPVVTGLMQPPGDTTRWYALEKYGRILVFANDPAVSTTSVALDLLGQSIIDGESGLLGLAFPPDYEQSRQVYVSYTRQGGATGMQSTLSRFVTKDAGKTFDPTSEQVLFSVDRPSTGHNGGQIEFGPDGLLYLAMGDGEKDPTTAQDPSSPFGKMLRFDVSKPSPLAPDVFASGLRNPWGWHFDRATGALWAGDVGDSSWEEIDVLERGGNYGWPLLEGAHCVKLPCDPGPFKAPVSEYGHMGAASVIGGVIYRGNAIPWLTGAYLYGDYSTGAVHALVADPKSGAWQDVALNPSGPFPHVSGFATDAAGEVYVLDYIAALVYAVLPASAPATDAFPRRLSETGCVDPGDPLRPAPGLVPYDVNAPFWSDGATKQRWLALPDGAQIHVQPDGDWDLPVGSVAMKMFSLGGTPVETRLFVRHEDGGWGGYSYAWNAAGTDAELLAANELRHTATGDWYFPSRSECVQCHGQAAGGTLGLETAQLARMFAYPGGRTADQLATLTHIGLLDANVALTALPDPGGSAPLEARARAYLHANCSFCHRPGGLATTDMDLRWSTNLFDAHVCDVPPSAGTLGLTDARRVAPGQPASSVLSTRIHTRDAERMPPIASRVADSSGADVVDAWIKGLERCPLLVPR